MNKQHPTMRPHTFSDVKAAPHNQSRSQKSVAILRWFKHLKWKSRGVRITVIVVVALLVGLLVRNYVMTRNELKKITDPAAAVAAEANKLAAKVGNYLELPQGETPTVATVKNVEQLNNQTFFERAKNGDKILVYPEAKRAVLYRPSTNKIIEYAPIETGVQ